MPFLSPSLVGAITRASGNGVESAFDLSSLTTVAIVAVGWTILAQFLPRWTADWRLQFFVYFAYLTSSVPILAVYFHRQFLPQPGRYKAEMELALPLLLVFGLRPWFQRVRFPVRTAVVFLLLALAGEQVVSHRRYARAVLQPSDVTRTIEYRTAIEAQRIGTRVMLPGSIAQWANVFTDVSQFSGGTWSKATNGVNSSGWPPCSTGVKHLNRTRESRSLG